MKNTKNTMDSMMPVWQLPVRERILEGKPDWVHPLAKFHCFVGGRSLCGNYEQITDFFETDIESGEIVHSPSCACKRCYEKWKKKYYMW
ncbi:hypothetical protein V3C10_04210 [[Clostridium] symbiosum]|uniref:hypothetical protein n=1 Tax=Clostridium symbiosum TaxID=1512 RepID=UPI001D05EB3F|nr:hypothetical protein [[Clostridium] symbiosum]MCB6610213.1 hypothetical protein [[Clostridium] symbiosum]MCB6933548.1 hypothetical protein [[Clostridium] symbiosum]